MSDFDRIIIWRHGQTDWNKENRYQGHSDIPLNSVGLFQVEHAAKILAAMKPEKIISSDLIRAQQTAQPLVALTGAPLELDPDLRETNGGKWEGRTREENMSEDRERFIKWISGGDIAAGITGERRSQVADRAMRAVEKGLATTTGTLVVVTHGGTARCLLGRLLDLPHHQWTVLGGLSNASWSVLEPSHLTSHPGWSLIEHNAGSIPEPLLSNEG